MKKLTKAQRKVIIAAVISVVLAGIFLLGTRTDNWKVNKEQRQYLENVTQIGYDTTGGKFNLTPPPGHFIQIDTVNMFIYVVDSVMLEE